MLDKDVGQGWFGQFETADDTAMSQCLLDNQIGVQIRGYMHLYVILPAFRHLHSLQRIQPESFSIVIELQSCHVPAFLAFHFPHAPPDNGPTLINNQDIFTQFLDLL